MDPQQQTTHSTLISSGAINMPRFQLFKGTNMVLLASILLINVVRLTLSYPIIMELEKNDRECIEFNIPSNDDANLLFLPLNQDIDPKVEDWYITEFSEITRHESGQYMKELNRYPTNVLNAQKSVSKSKISVFIEQIDAKPPSSRSYSLDYFKLFKVEDISETLSRGKKQGWDRALGQYSICFSNRGREDVRILFEGVKISEYEEKMSKRHLLKKEHLTPLEEAFEEGVALSHAVLDEMHYMEKREARMKQTTDGTNARIRYFSYLSVIILLGVTWIQIQYLKNYFKKKKVL